MSIEYSNYKLSINIYKNINKILSHHWVLSRACFLAWSFAAFCTVSVLHNHPAPFPKEFAVSSLKPNCFWNANDAPFSTPFFDYCWNFSFLNNSSTPLSVAFPISWLYFYFILIFCGGKVYGVSDGKIGFRADVWFKFWVCLSDYDGFYYFFSYFFD